MNDADAVIVGGGLGGATLALALARAGRTSIVLERDLSPRRVPRPEILWPATLAVFDRLGAGDAVRARAARPIVGVELHGSHGGRQEFLLRMDEDLRGAASLRRLSTDSVLTRGVLLDAAVATGRVRLERGIEVRRIARDADGATAVGVRGGEEVAARGAVIVGDDGADSLVRASLGIESRAKPFPLEFLCAVAQDDGALGDEAHGWVHPAGLADGIVGVFLVPLPHGRVSVLLPAAPGALARFAAAGVGALAAEIARICPRAARLVDGLAAQDFVAIRPIVGRGPRCVADRAALVGDAAHPVSPAGGQGANMAVADAVALADVLLARLASGDLSAAALAPYERARRSPNARSIAFSRLTARLVLVAKGTPLFVRALRLVVLGVDRSDAAKTRILRSMATSFVGGPVEL